MVTKRGLLQEEIRQTRPFASEEQEALLNLFRTADLLRHDLGRVVGKEGLTLQHYNVLRILRGAGDAGLPTLEIASRLLERSPGITRLVDRLEKAGLARRERTLEDRRCVYCYLTASGKDVLTRLDQPVTLWTRQQMRRLKTGEITELIRLLEDLRTTGG